VVLGRTPVFRLHRSATRVWGTFRYLRALSSWLWERREQTDVVYVAGLREEAYAALGALRGSGVPVVLRARGIGRLGDCHWQKSATLGSRIATRCRTADAIVATSQCAAQELKAARYPADRIEIIPDGVRQDGGECRPSRRAAREALAEVHPILQVFGDAPLALYAGPIRENIGLFDLVRAWPMVLERWPQARLWLAGDATGADALWEEIQELGLSENVIFPGAFDAFDDLLPAADLFVLPAHEPFGSGALLEALAAGIPVVAARTPFTEHVLTDGEHALLTPPTNIAALAEAMCRILSDPPLHGRLSSAARELARRRHNLQQTAEAHLSLFRRLTATRDLAVS
jgi:glycosyltransferase involved in cell wall biosynthesis